VETNNLRDVFALGDEKRYQQASITVAWSDKSLKRIVRLRLLSDPGFPVWDVSYCWGELRDGTPVRVRLPFHQLPKHAVTAAILTHARREHVYAKGLGLLDAVSCLQ